MRKTLFWTHLILGTTAAVVILIMCVTGVLLTYEQQMIRWADRGYRSSGSGTQLNPEELLQQVAAQTGKTPDSLTVRKDPTAPAEAAFGPSIVYADAYSGRVLGDGSKGIRRFFRVVTDWHRWLALEGPRRQFGRTLTGAANLMFLGLAVSGMYLWLPRKWSWSNVRAVLWFRGGLSGKARDFNWHNAIGIWCAVPLVAVIVGALVISYPWATNLVYKIAGSEAPRAGSGPGRPGGGPGGPGGPRGSGGPGGPGGQPRDADLSGIDRAFEQAKLRVPEWETLTVRPTAGRRISIAVAGSNRGRVDLRSSVIIERATGDVVEHEQFSSYDRGRRWRMWLRFIHTGEALGIAGQTIAGIASLGGAVLVWTGIALTWRRYRAWKTRRVARRADKPAPASV